MKNTKSLIVSSFIFLLIAVMLGGCIYTSNIVFPNKKEALYCFLDTANEESYLYRIDIYTRIPELEAKFTHPIRAISLSEDKKTLFYFDTVKDETSDSEKMNDKLNLKMLPLSEIQNPDKAKTVCTFVIDAEAGSNLGTSWGFGNIIPLVQKGIVFALYIEQENKIVLARIDLKTGTVKTIDDGIVSYLRLSPNAKYVAYTKSQKIKVQKDDEEKDAVKSSIIVLDPNTLKEVEKKDVGIWEIPPQYSFIPAGKDDYKIIYPSPESESDQPVPKGAKIQMHYISSLQYVSGSKRLFIYGPSEKDDKAIGEICDINSNIIETINCGEFLPISWSPDESFFFLGANNYLAQYILGKNIFAVYMFIPPIEKGKEPEIRSTLLRDLPENTGKDFRKSKED